MQESNFRRTRRLPSMLLISSVVLLMRLLTQGVADITSCVDILQNSHQMQLLRWRLRRRSLLLQREFLPRPAVVGKGPTFGTAAAAAAVDAAFYNR